MEHSEFTFTTDLTIEDYRGLCWMLVSKTVYLLGILAAAAVGLTMYPRLDGNIFICAVISVLVFFLLYFAERWYINWRANRVFLSSNVSSELKLYISGEGIRQNSSSGEIALPWDEVHRVRENKDCFFVFLNKTRAFYFPKRSFESKEHRDRFVELMIENLPPARVFFR